MSRIQITYLITFVFIISIANPVIISFSDLSYDCTELLDKGEEEENKAEESVQDAEFRMSNSNYYIVKKKELKKTHNLKFDANHYQNDFVKIFSPPPEVVS